MYIPAELIKKKKLNQEHSAEEINFIIQSYTRGDLPDYQMAAWLMAVYFQGMSPKEAAFLTEAMIQSGERIQFSSSLFPVDKHSTGGVGDKASMILAPIVAAAGVPVPMIAGRGLGHTGGTLDKLESIKGFDINLSTEEFRQQVEDIGLCIIGQTREICPADKKIYALRDITGTVDSLPLICGSILSKKIAEGIKGLVMDIKVGSGAFMKTLPQAEELAQALTAISEANGVQMSYFISDMNQPLGRFIGNGLEIIECVDILQNKKHLVGEFDFYSDTRELSLELAGAMITIGKKIPSKEDGLKEAREILNSGQAYKKFIEMVSCQKGLVQDGHIAFIKASSNKKEIYAQQSGHIKGFNCEQIGVAGIQLKAGRLETTDHLDHGSGIEMHRKIGDNIQKGDLLFTLYGDNEDLFTTAEKTLHQSVLIDEEKVENPKLIYKEYIRTEK